MDKSDPACSERQGALCLEDNTAGDRDLGRDAQYVTGEDDIGVGYMGVVNG